MRKQSCEICETCRFWDCEGSRLWDGNNIADCRRRAPIGTEDLWPVISSDDWCGEHEARERHVLLVLADVGYELGVLPIEAVDIRKRRTAAHEACPDYRDDRGSHGNCFRTIQSDQWCEHCDEAHAITGELYKNGQKRGALTRRLKRVTREMQAI